ncbi:Probable carboxylesterase 13 [Linum perenne]
MAPSDEIERDFPGFFKVYNDGRVQRYWDTGDHVPAGLDSETGVETKDVVISQQTGVKARIFLPKLSGEAKLPVILHFHGGGFCIGSPFSPPFKIYLSALATQTNSITISIDYRLAPEHKLPIAFDDCWKLPLIVYFHGGGFCIETPFTHKYHRSVNLLASQVKAIAVSVDYRLAPEHPLPIGYDDSWSCLEWIASHSNGAGPEPWLNSHADFSRVYFAGDSAVLAGDSAGANIVHHVAMRFGQEERIPQLGGLVMIHPYFAGNEPVGNEPVSRASRGEMLWKLLAHPSSTSGLDDPYINPAFDPKLAGLGCSKVLVMVAEKDFLRDRGNYYYELLKGSGWKGEVEIVETNGEDHVFHLKDNDCANAVNLRKKICSFINN